MEMPSTAVLLRIFIGESDSLEGSPLHEVLVEKARKDGLAGATVTKGIMGFGADSRMHTAKILRLSEDLPVIIEIVDRPERIEKYISEIDPMIEEGLVTTENVSVIAYRHHKGKGL